MKEKSVPAKKSRKKHIEEKQTFHVSSNSQEKTDKILIENFVSLQKVLTNLSLKFDNLANQINKLLELFEISAKTLTEKDFDFGRSDKNSAEIIKKLDTLSEQNKIIARGLTLVHEKIPGGGEETKQPVPQKIPGSTQTFRPELRPAGPGMGGYQKSLSTKE